MFFYAIAIYGMLNNVKQNGSGKAERMSGFVGVRMPAPILVKFSGFAVADGRTPSSLMRKLATDYVAERELHAVPLPPAVQSSQQAPQAQHQSPWDI